ncbi:permease-like cell division protein FtsX [Hamadaea tsunoensis]|uniref:permease-like cell division protein FtsX n=1 Tax=Hamadaea tsunoensis TaxID=53368 RepID=UPI000412FFFB|nr:permease-like cell division protein FtsX [Hamadaea tsunoensis]
MTDLATLPAPEPAEQPSPRGRLRIAAVAVVAMLVGAAAATGILSLTGLPGQPVHRFSVFVYLTHDVTADQKASIRAALPSFDPTGDITFVSRDDAWRIFQERAKDFPDLLKGTTADSLPESFTLQTKGRLFDCTGYAKVRHLPGVDRIQVLQQRVADYGATIVCDAEYAS